MLSGLTTMVVCSFHPAAQSTLSLKSLLKWETIKHTNSLRWSTATLVQVRSEEPLRSSCQDGGTTLRLKKPISVSVRVILLCYRRRLTCRSVRNICAALAIDGTRSDDAPITPAAICKQYCLNRCVYGS